MKSIKFAVTMVALLISVQGCGSMMKSVAADAPVEEGYTLYFGTVTSMEPINMKEFARRTSGSETGSDAMQMGSMVSGGSITGMVLGGAIGYAANAVSTTAVKKIDGYRIAVLSDQGERIIALNRKDQAEAYGVEVGKRVSVLRRPTDVLIVQTDITKEQAPAEIARRAPHQLQKPSAAAAEPAVAAPIE